MADRELRLRMIFEAMDKATGPMRSVGTGAKAMANQLKASTDELRRLDQTQKQITGFRTLKMQSVETGRALKAAEERTAALAREMAAAGTPTKKLAADFERAKRDAAALKNTFGEQQTRLQSLRNELSQSGVSTSNLASDQAKLRADMARATAEIDEQKAALEQLSDREKKVAAGREAMDKTQARAANMAVGGAAAVGAGMAIGAPLVAATQEAITFESKMIDVKKVMNDVSPAQLTKIESGLLAMSAQGPIAAAGLAQIAAEGARAGIAANDLLGFTEGAMKMAAAFDITAEEAGAMMATWKTGLELTIPQIQLLGDKVNALTNTYGGNAAEVTKMITAVGPLGKIGGVASGEMAAMAQLMNSVGVQADVGATGIKNMILRLNAGAAATKEQNKAFTALGLDAEKMAKTMQVDARGGILSVLDALNKLPKEQQMSTLTQLFGSESVAAIAPMLGSLDQLKSNFNLVGDAQKYTGSMNAEFATAMSKTENQIASAGGAVGSLGISVGQHLLPMVQVATGFIKNMAVGLTDWAGKHPALVKGIALTVGVIAALLVVVGGLAIGIAAVMGPFALLRYSLILSRGQFAAMKTTMTGIPGRLTAIKGAASGAATWLRTAGAAALTAGKRALVGAAHWARQGAAFVAGKAVAMTGALRTAGAAALTSGRRALIATGSWLKMAAGFVVGKIAGAARALMAVGKAALFMGRAFLLNPVTLIITAIAVGAYLIYRYWDQIVPFFTGLWARAKQIFSAAWEGIKSLFFKYHPAGLIYTHWGSITAWFGKLWSGVKAVLSTAWAGIKSLFFNYHPAGLIYTHWGAITAWFGALWEGVKAVLSAGWEGIKSLFFNYHPAGLIYTHWGSITSWFANLWAKVRSVFSNAWTAIKSLVGTWPATMVSIGTRIVNAIADGIRAAPGAVYAALKSVIFGGINAARSLIGLGPMGGGASPPKVAAPKLAGARARGGPVQAGKSYLVGEEGPEIFTAHATGRIIPNDKLRAAIPPAAAIAAGGGGTPDATVINRPMADVPLNQRPLSPRANGALPRAANDTAPSWARAAAVGVALAGLAVQPLAAQPLAATAQAAKVQGDRAQSFDAPPFTAPSFDPPQVTGRSRTTPIQPAPNYTIQIHVDGHAGDGEDLAEQIAAAVEKAMAKVERDRAATTRSAFDDEDYA